MGYKLNLRNRRSCIFVHPCRRKNKGGCSHICRYINRRAYRCICKKGYRRVGRKSCRKLHPCEIRRGGCHHLCKRRGKGKFECKCRRGWELTKDKKRCRRSCRRLCNQRYNPVCGSNKQTYSNKCRFGVARCEARRNGQRLRIIRNGKCPGPNPCLKKKRRLSTSVQKK